MSIFFPETTYKSDGQNEYLIAKAELYREIASWTEKRTQVVAFSFSPIDVAYLQVSVHLDGREAAAFALEIPDGWYTEKNEVKVWLEDCVTNPFIPHYLSLAGAPGKVEPTSDFDCEFEYILGFDTFPGSSAEPSVFDDPEDDEDAGRDYSNDTCLFTLNSETGRFSVACLCNRRQFVHALYGGLLWYDAHGNIFPEGDGRRWYYSDSPDYGEWGDYNCIKSPVLDAYISSYRHFYPRKKDFGEAPTILETVLMCPKPGSGLFWHQRGGCSGETDTLVVDSQKERIDLSGITGLKEWYDESVRHAGEGWQEKEYFEWAREGWNLALQVKQLLPECVDLFFQLPASSLRKDASYNDDNLPVIVPDIRNR